MNILLWWHERGHRERLVLTIATGVVIILAVYLAMEPILIERNRMRDSLPQLRTDLLWMKQNVSKLKSLQLVQGDSDISVSGQVSLSTVQSIINRLALQDTLDELGPGSGQAVRIQFGQIGFPELMGFLYQLKATSNTIITTARISRLEEDQGMGQALIIIGG